MSIKPNDDGPHNAEGPRMPFPVLLYRPCGMIIELGCLLGQPDKV